MPSLLATDALARGDVENVPPHLNTGIYVEAYAAPLSPPAIDIDPDGWRADVRRWRDRRREAFARAREQLDDARQRKISFGDIEEALTGRTPRRRPTEPRILELLAAAWLGLGIDP